MKDSIKKNHWETVYETKNPDQVSWTQELPIDSIELIELFNVTKKASIIDVGGGDSKLVDYLLREGYEHITVLDISAKAIEKAKNRLGEQAKKVNWIVCDITKFEPKEKYDVWHDRATFHFLTTNQQIEKYIAIVNDAVSCYLSIGTFSNSGPTKCSGLDIIQYNEEKLTSLFNNGFEKINCKTKDHITPFNTIQNFLFCSFKRQIL
jgi:SAM-dependent methyltransferase